MHHSDNPKRRTVTVAHYVDDSGTDEGSEFAVVGGPVLSRQQFFSFHYEWDRLVRSKHRITGSIHMKEFARPHGRLAYLTDDQRRALFADLVRLVNDSKAYSLTIFVRNQEFRHFFPVEEFRRLFGPAPHAFFWCLLWNHILVDRWSSDVERMAYVVSKSDSDSQMLEAHSAFQHMTDTLAMGSWTGGIGFDTPKNVMALQAADVVAWSNRKLSLGEPFADGFEPLAQLTEKLVTRTDGSQVGHIHQEVTRKHTEHLSAAIRGGSEPLRKIGRLELAKWVKTGW